MKIKEFKEMMRSLQGGYVYNNIDDNDFKKIIDQGILNNINYRVDTRTVFKIILNNKEDQNKIKQMEELAELIQAISKGDRNNIVEEIADVQIIIKQLLLLYQIPHNEVQQIINYKLDRYNKNNP